MDNGEGRTRYSLAACCERRLAISFVGLLCYVASVTMAQWTSNIRNGSQPSDLSISGSGGSPPSFRVQYAYTANGVIKYSSFGGLTNAMLPGGCYSNAASVNKYGFQHWSTQFFTFVVRSNPNFIFISLSSLPGYVLLADETITCPIPSSVQTSVPLSPPQFSFTVVASTSSAVTYFMSNAANGQTSDLEDTTVRLYGFTLSLQLYNDVWNSDAVDTIVGGFSTSIPDSLRGTLALLINNATAVIDPSTPNKISFVPPPSAYQRFNIFATLTVRFVPSPSMTYKKSQITESRSFIITGSPYSPIITTRYGSQSAADSSVELSEVCFRDPNCLRQIAFDVRSASPNKDDAKFRLPDVNMTLAFVASMVMAAELETYRSRLLPPQNAFRRGGSESQLLLNFSLIWDFDVSTTSNLTFYIPYDFILTYKPPDATSPLKLVIVPAAGMATGNATSITSDVIWKGGWTLNITLIGETWLQDGLLPKLLNAWQGSWTGANGWTSGKSGMVTPSSLSFPSNRTLIVTLNQNVDYQVTSQTATENVTLVLTGDMVTSGLTPLMGKGVTFTITTVPGQLVVSGRSTFQEADWWNGAIVFSLTLAGDAWHAGGNLSECVLKMTASWVWATASATSEVNPDVEAALRNISNYQLVTNRTLVVTLPAFPTYQINVTEYINLNVPQICTAAQKFKPTSKAVLMTLPQRAVVTVWFETDGVQIQSATLPSIVDPTQTLASITESILRKGNLHVVFSIEFDWFDFSAMASAFQPQSLNEGLASLLTGTGTGLYGWQAKHSQMVDVEGIDTSNAQRIVIPINFYAPYTIAVPEEVFMTIEGSWMVSQYPPLNRTAFVVDVSPGLCILRSWYGQGRNVTESDMRRGVVWFQLSLLGDNWVSNRAGFVASIRGAKVSDPSVAESSGTTAQRESLTPEPSYYNITFDGNYDHLRLVLQATDWYDISEAENVTISISSLAVASGLPPSWFNEVTGVSLAAFSFIVIPVAGLLITTGSLNIDEATFRISGAWLWLTLFGETWVQGADAVNKIRSYTVGSDPCPTCFTALRNTTMPASSVTFATDRLLMLRILANPAYSINVTETVALYVQPFMFASKIVPRFVGTAQPPGINVAVAGGNFFLTVDHASEAWFAANNTNVSLRLDGDTWRGDVIAAYLSTFLQGFTSNAVLLQSPNGFTRYRDAILNGSSVAVSADASEAVVSLCGVCAAALGFRMSLDETITFTVPNAIFTGSGVPPSPASAAFVLSVSPKWLIMELSQQGIAGNVNYPSRRFDDATFLAIVSTMLSVDTNRLLVQSSFSQSAVIAKLAFVGAATTTDDRTPLELAGFVLSLNATFISAWLSTTRVYLESSGPPIPVVPDVPAPVVIQTVVSLSQQVPVWAWLVLFAGIILMAAVVIYTSEVLQRRRRPVLHDQSGKAQRVPVVINATYLTGDDEWHVTANDVRIAATQSQHQPRRRAEATTRQRPQAVLVPDGYGADRQRVSALRAHVRANLQRERQFEADQKSVGRSVNHLAVRTLTDQ